jgi:hypothetical protein
MEDVADIVVDASANELHCKAHALAQLTAAEKRYDTNKKKRVTLGAKSRED